MAKTKEEQINYLNAKIVALEEKKKELDKKILEAKKKRDILQIEADKTSLDAIKALGISMEELTKLAEARAREKTEEAELAELERLEKEELTN